MGVISQNGIDYPVPSVQVQSDGTATDLTNDRVPTGQTIKSYLNSNLINKVNIPAGGSYTLTLRNSNSAVFGFIRAESTYGGIIYFSQSNVISIVGSKPEHITITSSGSSPYNHVISNNYIWSIEVAFLVLSN